MTIDPIALRQKLSKRHIGPKHPQSLENAVQAVQEREMEVARYRDPGVEETQRTIPMGILSQEEIAYCVHSFAMQWDLPA